MNISYSYLHVFFQSLLNIRVYYVLYFPAVQVICISFYSEWVLGNREDLVKDIVTELEKDEVIIGLFFVSSILQCAHSV